jgi:hypothetical protein
MTINENGQRKRISKHKVAIKQLIKLAMTGNTQALRKWHAYCGRVIVQDGSIRKSIFSVLRSSARQLVEEEHSRSQLESLILEYYLFLAIG